MADETFTTVTLPVAGNATVIEGKGKHFFSAMAKAGSQPSLMMKFLIMELVLVDGKKLTEIQIDEMHLRDISYLSVVINTMMSNELNAEF